MLMTIETLSIGRTAVKSGPVAAAAVTAEGWQPFTRGPGAFAAWPQLPAWLPWVALVAVALASTAFGIVCPDTFAVAMSDGFTW
jgi:hypothetical protein